MPYTQSLLEQELKKAEHLKISMPWRLFVFSLMIFLASVLIFSGLRIGYSSFLNSQIKNIDSEIESLSQSVSEEEKENFIKFYSQLFNINDLLGSRLISSKLISFLEKNTFNQIYYSALNFNAKDRELRVSGVASSYDAVARQLQIYQSTKEVEGVFFENSQNDKDIKGTRFEARLKFKKGSFKD